MVSSDELESVGRIILAIKTYRQQTADLRNPQDNELLSTFLQTELSD